MNISAQKNPPAAQKEEEVGELPRAISRRRQKEYKYNNKNTYTLSSPFFYFFFSFFENFFFAIFPDPLHLNLCSNCPLKKACRILINNSLHGRI